MFITRERILVRRELYAHALGDGTTITIPVLFQAGYNRDGAPAAAVYLEITESDLAALACQDDPELGEVMLCAAAWAKEIALNELTADEAARAAHKPAAPLPPINRKQGFVYLVESAGYHKIGISKNVANRMAGMVTNSPLPFTLVHTITTDDMAWAESQLHQRYAAQRVRGEWFDLCPDDIAYICAIADLNSGG